MNPWRPETIWDDEPCYIIGGGPSLRDFDWALLEGLHTIGCNSAFRLNPEVCIFGDRVFWETHHEELEGFKGLVVSNLPDFLRNGAPDWVKPMRRKARGIGTEDTLAWNSNTGALAINLALLFGASPTYLLGFDMAPAPNGGNNWYDRGKIPTPRSDVYNRFLRSFPYLVKGMKEHFPDREVINLVGPLGSALNDFPRQPLEEHEFGGVHAT